MSITAPCVIIFDEVPYTGVLPLFVYAPDATFKTMHLGTSTWDQMDSHTGFEIRGGEGILYDNDYVWDGGNWTSNSLRGIYVESWGDTAEGLDALEAFLQGPNTDSGALYPADLTGQKIQFHETDILAYKTYGFILFSSNGITDFDYMHWDYNGSRLRYDHGTPSVSIYPYTASNGWTDTAYRTVTIGSSSSTDYTKPAFVLWIWFNAEPIPLPTYKLGWRYTPLS